MTKVRPTHLPTHSLSYGRTGRHSDHGSAPPSLHTATTSLPCASCSDAICVFAAPRTLSRSHSGTSQGVDSAFDQGSCKSGMRFSPNFRHNRSILGQIFTVNGTAGPDLGISVDPPLQWTPRLTASQREPRWLPIPHPTRPGQASSRKMIVSTMPLNKRSVSSWKAMSITTVVQKGNRIRDRSSEMSSGTWDGTWKTQPGQPGRFSSKTIKYSPTPVRLICQLPLLSSRGDTQAGKSDNCKRHSHLFNKVLLSFLHEESGSEFSGLHMKECPWPGPFQILRRP